MFMSHFIESLIAYHTLFIVVTPHKNLHEKCWQFQIWICFKQLVQNLNFCSVWVSFDQFRISSAKFLGKLTIFWHESNLSDFDFDDFELFLKRPTWSRMSSSGQLAKQ